MKVYHRVAVQQPFERISLDIIGPYLVKASNTGRALVKLHSLLAVCLSTGLVTQVVMDGADFATVVRSIFKYSTFTLMQAQHSLK